MKQHDPRFEIIQMCPAPAGLQWYVISRDGDGSERELIYDVVCFALYKLSDKTDEYESLPRMAAVVIEEDYCLTCVDDPDFEHRDDARRGFVSRRPQ